MTVQSSYVDDLGREKRSSLPYLWKMPRSEWKGNPLIMAWAQLRASASRPLLYIMGLSAQTRSVRMALTKPKTIIRQKAKA